MTLSEVLIPLAGGVLIGIASLSLMAFNGRIAGVSGLLAGVATGPFYERFWRSAFIAGLVVGGLGLLALRPTSFTLTPAPLWGVVVAGLLVGYGTRLGRGCTSGHGVCGISRMSVRSVVATLTFIATGAAAVAITRALGA